MSHREHEFLNPARAVAAVGLREGMTVADFGTGSGFFARAAARAVGTTGRVFAVDVHRELLARLRTFATAEGLRNIDVVAGDIEAHGGSMLPSGSVDFVIAANILSSSEHRERIAEEVWRVLRSTTRAGRALVIDWNPQAGGFGPRSPHAIPRDEARRIFEQNGFVFEKDIPAGDFHWGFLVAKR